MQDAEVDNAPPPWLTFVAAGSLAVQALAFVGIAYLVIDLANLRYIATPEMFDDPRLFIPYVQETISSYWPAIGVGVVGASITIFLFTRGLNVRWFAATARLAGWLWLPFLPVGTIVGLMILHARRFALAQESER